MNPAWKTLYEKCSPFSHLILQIAVYDLHTEQDKCVIILETDPQEILGACLPLLKFCENKKLPIPLVITRAFVSSSLDSYPLEFLNISSDYINVYEREDLLKDLKFDPKDIRLQMERELKSKWLHTRMSLLQSHLKPKNMHAILHMSLKAIIPTLKGLFLLLGHNIPKIPEQVFSQANEMTDFDISILKKVDKASTKELSIEMVNEYLLVLGKLTNLMETWVL